MVNRSKPDEYPRNAYPGERGTWLHLALLVGLAAYVVVQGFRGKLGTPVDLGRK